MKNNIIPFQFRQAAIRVIQDENGEPFFVAKDVAKALGYSNTSKAINTHCKGVTTCPTETGGQVRHILIIPERDVYRLIMRSKLPAAEKFEEWVVSEVLPSIRKHGGYMTPEKVEEAILNPDTLIKLATALKDEQLKRREAEKRIEQDRPKVVFAESVEVAETTILIGELAKLVKQSTGYDVGQRRMFEWMRENGYLHKSGSSYNLPTQRSMNLGVFMIKEGTISRSDGTHITRTTKVTGKGQLYFVKKFHELMKARRTSAGRMDRPQGECRA